MRWLAAVVVPVLIAGLALGGFLYARLFLPTSLRAREADRAVLVTIADLESSLARFTPRTDAELLKKTQFPDGHVELKYEYLHPDNDRPLYVFCVVEIHPTRKSAREAYAAHALATIDTIEGPADYVDLAEFLGADSDEVALALFDGRHADEVRADHDAGRALGVVGTPTFVVDGLLIDATGTRDGALVALVAQVERARAAR